MFELHVIKITKESLTALKNIDDQWNDPNYWSSLANECLVIETGIEE